MLVNFSNIKLNTTFAKSNMEFKKIRPAFRGNEKAEESKNNPKEQINNYATAQVHPALILSAKLLQDGYTVEDVKEHKVFTEIDIDGAILARKNLLEDVTEGNVTKEDLLLEKTKCPQDIHAMQRAYLILKAKFNTPDVQKHVSEHNKFFLEFKEVMKSLGKKDIPEKTYSHKTMILSLLHYTNKENEPILRELLKDDNFNNACISHALIGIKKGKDPKPALKVIKMAQEIGYEKDFSWPLAILVSEANEQNLPMIEKMLYEQEFLTENHEFVSSRLMTFLRSAGAGFAEDYVKDDQITLEIVEELFEMQDKSEDLDLD